MKKGFWSLLAVLMVSSLSAQKVIDLPIQGTNGITEEESVGSFGEVRNITAPRIDLYLPQNKANQPLSVILIIPGGAYEYVSARNEGVAVAELLNKQGYAAAVLKYRLPNGHEHIPLLDAKAAMQYLREHAKEYNFAPKGFGVMGFSAGGHLAASLLTMCDNELNRPDYGILFYPVLSMESDTHQKTRRLLLGNKPSKAQIQRWTLRNAVTANVPPTFIAACQDDKGVAISNSLNFYAALTAAGVQAELLIMPVGGHGWGFERDFPMKKDVLYPALFNWLDHTISRPETGESLAAPGAKPLPR